MPINLIHGDCMEGMKKFPDGHFDLAIVDPPYGLGLDMINNHNLSKRTIVKHEKKSWNDCIPDESYFKELHRVSKHQIIWGCNYYAQYIPAKGRIIHDKITGREENKHINFSHADLASCSLFNRIVIFRYQWAGNKQGGKINWKNEGPDRRIHPTQKPIALYKWLLKKYAKPGDKILDTHLGSGSIAIACHDMGFDLTAYEIDKDYYDAALKRLKIHQSQLTLL